MSGGRAGELYDALHALESRFRKTATYPVHKALHFANPGVFDIYDWIIDRVALSERQIVLDAGCGVGFGAFRLVERGARRVTGISPSAGEIACARETARRSSLDDRIEFQCATFEELPTGAFDLVVAVESLKHSLDLPSSIRALLRSVKRGGQLVIVEDLATSAVPARCAKRVALDWHLTQLYEEDDYRAALGTAECRVEDLSSAVRPSGSLVAAARLVSIQFLLPFVPRRIAKALRAFRGGVHIDRLYAREAMAYKAFFCRGDGRL